MVQVLQRREDPSVRIGQQLGGIVEAGVEGYQKGKQKVKEKEEVSALEEQYKMKLSSNPDIRKIQIQAAEKERQRNAGFDRRMALWGDQNEEGQAQTNESSVKGDDGQPYTPKIEIPQDDVMTQPKKTDRSLKLPFSKKQISMAAAEDPVQARLMNDQNIAAERSFLKERELSFKEKQADIEEKRHQNKASEKYYNSLQDSAQAAQEANRSLSRQKEKIGDISTKDRLVSLLSPKWQTLLKSDSAMALDSNIASQFSGQRQLLGGILSDSDIRFLLSKMVTSDKSKEANEYIVDWKMLENDITIAQAEIASEITEENGGYRPANFQALVRERSNAIYGDKIKQSFDKMKSLPDDPKELEKVWRKKVPEGTPLSQEGAMKYKKMYGKEQGKIKAAEDGYAI